MKNPLFSLPPVEKPQLPNLTLPLNRSRSTPGHHLLRIIGLPVMEKNILKVFTIYGHGSHLGHETWTIYINLCSPYPWRLHMEFGFDWPSGFIGEDV